MRRDWQRPARWANPEMEGRRDVPRWAVREWGLNKRPRDGSVSCVKTFAPILAVLAVAFGVRVSAASDFVGFLKDPPPIRKVVYFRAGEAFQVNGQHLTHPILFEGGIESDTWYERTLPTPESQVYYQQFGTCRGCSRSRASAAVTR